MKQLIAIIAAVATASVFAQVKPAEAPKAAPAPAAAAAPAPAAAAAPAAAPASKDAAKCDHDKDKT